MVVAGCLRGSGVEDVIIAPVLLQRRSPKFAALVILLGLSG